jgi:hypothetical protein
MPSTSKAQQSFMGREYAKVKAGGRSSTGMSLSQLRDFAATKRSGLPGRARQRGSFGGKPVGSHT